jgi:hypothetical protein
MKTLGLLSLTITLCISCTKEPMDISSTGNVKISIDYGFPSSGNITTKGNSVYLDFYTKYIASKILTPHTYTLLFEGINNHLTTAVSGKWANKDLVALPPDRYAIQGSSYPTKYDLCGDTCYLEFHDTVDITQTSTSVILKADYVCSLILLDTTNVKSTEFQGVMTGWTYKTTMLKTEGFYSSFITGKPMDESEHSSNVHLDLVVTERNNKVVTILLWTYSWEDGKYYYFGNTDNNYNLSPMTSN